jgi:hypothetical protein
MNQTYKEHAMNITLVLRHIRRLACASVVAALTSTALEAQPDIPGRPKLVYRVDTLPPQVMFREGQSTNGKVLSLLEHTRGASCINDIPERRSFWLSTTSDRGRAERFLRQQFERAAERGEAAPPTWLYTIRTDDSFMSVVNIFQQVIRAGIHEQERYDLRHVDVLHRLLAIGSLRADAEVVTHRFSAERIVSAEPVSYQPNAIESQQLQWAPGISNAGYQAPPPALEMDNFLADFHQLVPPLSVDFHGFTRNVASCFQTCDRSGRTHRQKRELAAVELDHCPAEPAAAEAFIASDD